jgi:hypothetical protein
MKKFAVIIFAVLLTPMLFSENVSISKNQIYSLIYKNSEGAKYLIFTYRQSIRDEKKYFAIKVISQDEYLKLASFFNSCTKIEINYRDNDTIDVFPPNPEIKAYILKDYFFIFKFK